ncbi:MAG: hypothetical protein J0G95_01635, partial [Rhizobiales bacterium]|nr:hypothetical protein [Hyphomicrobiales bacterium]
MARAISINKASCSDISAEDPSTSTVEDLRPPNDGTLLQLQESQHSNRRIVSSTNESLGARPDTKSKRGTADHV